MHGKTPPVLEYIISPEDEPHRSLSAAYPASTNAVSRQILMTNCSAESRIPGLQETGRERDVRLSKARQGL